MRCASRAGATPAAAWSARWSGARIELTAERDGDLVSTVDVFFALLDVYGGAFDRALYIRGTTRIELTSALSANGHPVPAPYGGGTPAGRFDG